MKDVKTEKIKNTAKYSFEPEFSKESAEKAVAFIIRKVDENLNTFTDFFPDYGRNQRYGQIDNVLWTSSFWTGMLWLAYEMTGEAKYRQVAQHHTQSFKKRIDERIKVDNHDLGFLYSLSCVTDYKLTGNTEARDIALRAADYLITRYHQKAGIIQAWGDFNNPEELGRMIIDCNMNLPLLYWASQVTGKTVYREIAERHINQAAKYIVREDASSFHTYYMDIDTGAPKYGKTRQGYSDSSCWSRGQAWGIYGFTLSYIYTGDYKLIELSEKLGNYFLNRLPKDDVCYWDLIFTEGAEERDSSAAAIAACGFLELSKHLPLTDKYKRMYENAALRILESLTENYTSKNLPESNAVLLHAVGAKPLNSNVDEPLIFGDYYYFEALVRVLKDWTLYW